MKEKESKIELKLRGGGEETFSLSYEEFEERIVKGEIPPGSLVRSQLLTGENWQPVESIEIFKGLYSDIGILFKKEFGIKRIPIITLVFASLMIGYYILIQLYMGEMKGWAPLVMGAKVEEFIILFGEWWRLITYNLVNVDRLHLLGNLMFLFIFGLLLENSLSRKSYFIVIAVSSLFSSYFSTLFTKLPSAGSSGVVMGIIGGSIVFGIKYRRFIPSNYSRLFGVSLLPYLWLIIYSSLTLSLVDHWGHLGGFLGGSLISIFLPAGIIERDERFKNKYWYQKVLVIVLVGIISVHLLGGFIVKSRLIRWNTYEELETFEFSLPSLFKLKGFTTTGFYLYKSPYLKYPIVIKGMIKHKTEVTLEELQFFIINKELVPLRGGNSVQQIKLRSKCIENSNYKLQQTFLKLKFIDKDGEPVVGYLCLLLKDDIEYKVMILNFSFLDRKYSTLYNKIFKSIKI